MSILPRNVLLSSLVVACVGLLSGCEIAPLQVTPQPREEIVEGPTDMPEIPAPDPAAAEVPEGYRVEVFAKDLIYPTSIEFGKNGEAYIAEAGYVYGDHAAPARVWRVSPDGELTIVADQLNGPVTDLLFHDGRLYISHRGKISVLLPRKDGGAGP
jgi:glucose/arabinose dehydrogenase